MAWDGNAAHRLTELGSWPCFFSFLFKILSIYLPITYLFVYGSVGDAHVSWGRGREEGRRREKESHPGTSLSGEPDPGLDLPTPRS